MQLSQRGVSTVVEPVLARVAGRLATMVRLNLEGRRKKQPRPSPWVQNRPSTLQIVWSNGSDSLVQAMIIVNCVPPGQTGLGRSIGLAFCHSAGVCYDCWGPGWDSLGTRHSRSPTSVLLHVEEAWTIARHSCTVVAMNLAVCAWFAAATLTFFLWCVWRVVRRHGLRRRYRSADDLPLFSEYRHYMY